MFRAEPVPKGSHQKTVHEELAKSLTLILRPANADQLVVTKFLNNSWFFFEVLVKSMTQFLIDGERVKVTRVTFLKYEKYEWDPFLDAFYNENFVSVLFWFS